MMQELTHRNFAQMNVSGPQVSEMTREERRRRVEDLGREFAQWSAELNRRLA